MKNIFSMFSIITLMVISPIIGYSQIDSTKIETKLDNLEKSLEEIKKLINSQTDSSTSVGVFKLFKKDSLQVYFCDNKKCNTSTQKDAGFKVNIDKVIIDISNGVITDIQIITKENKTFTNSKTSISINRFERCDLLQFKHGLNYYYIQTCDFINFERQGNYFADDIRFELKDKNESKTILKSVGINSLINVKVYSDLLGTFGGEDNGIIQTEANLKTPINTSNFKNMPIIPFNFFTSNIRLSKLDDKFKYTSVNYSKNDTTITGNDTIVDLADTSFSKGNLLQRSWFNFDIGFNLFTVPFGNKAQSGFALDVVSGFALSNFKNSSDSSIVSLPYWGIRPSLNIYPAPNFGITITSQFIKIYSPQLSKEEFGKPHNILSPEFELFWHPKKSPSSKIFTRVQYTIITGEENPYYIWQLGYNLSISEIINKKLNE